MYVYSPLRLLPVELIEPTRPPERPWQQFPDTFCRLPCDQAQILRRELDLARHIVAVSAKSKSCASSPLVYAASKARDASYSTAARGLVEGFAICFEGRNTE